MKTNKQTVDMVFYDQKKKGEIHGILPSLSSLGARIVEIKKDVITESLIGLVADVKDILNELESMDTNGVRLKDVSISVQFSLDGGVQWIASSNAGVSNSMTLNFEINGADSSE